MIIKYLGNFSVGLILAVVMMIFAPLCEANAQVLLHDKRLKTTKQGEKTKERKLFKKKDSESSKKAKTDIRTTEPGGRNRDKRTSPRTTDPGGRVKDNRTGVRTTDPGGRKKDNRTGVRTTDPGGRVKEDRNLSSPSYEEGSHRLDEGERDFNRPFSPETSFSGRKRSRKKEKNPNKDFSSYGGDLKSSSNVVKPSRVVPKASKGVKGKTQNQLKKEFERMSAGYQQYSGSMKVRKSKKDENPNKSSSFYTGNLKSSSTILKPQRGVYLSNKGSKGKSEKKIAKGFEGKSKEIHQYGGKVKIPSLSSRTKYFEKFSKNVHQHGGEIRIKKSKLNNLHPSVSYLEGKKKNSYEKKEKLRKRKISWFKFWKNSDQPNSVKEKPAKPKYDSRENEIWYD